jgi:hypothetical protein
MQKRLFKVLTHIDKPGGGGFWMRVGSAFSNKDDSINIYLDAMPKNFELHLRELDEEDLRKRETTGASPSRTNPAVRSAPSANPAEAIPF